MDRKTLFPDLSLSVFFPAYNEGKNIRKTVEAASRVLPGLVPRYEIIVVDDGSRDHTADVVESMMHDDTHIRLVRHEGNKGYGQALRTGIEAARLDWIFFCDADMQFDIGEIENFLKHAGEYDAVIGYRKKRQDRLIRILNAKMWNMANYLLFGLRARDIDCAFKLMKSGVIKSIPLHSSGAMISAEMLLKLNDAGVRIKELPVTHFPRGDGQPTGGNIGVIIKAFREMGHLYSQEMGNNTQIQFIKFAMIGVMNTLVAILIYIGLTRSSLFFSSNYLVAVAISYLCGTVVSYLFNKQWTFRALRDVSKLPRFYLNVAYVLAFNLLSVYILVSHYELYDVSAFIIAALCTAVWNFTASKYFVFNKAERASFSNN